jgi:hypothetical protein
VRAYSPKSPVQISFSQLAFQFLPLQLYWLSVGTCATSRTETNFYVKHG